MQNDGYIKISRKLLDWEHAGNMRLLGFWVFLLLRVRWEDSRRIKRGQCLTTYDGLAEDTGLSRATVANYLRQLKESGEITTERQENKTKITIVNWDRYQKYKFYTTDETPDETPDETTDQTADETTLLYKRKKERNKEIIDSLPAPPSLENVIEFCQSRKNKVDPERFWNYYQARGWQVNGQPIKDWQAMVISWEKNGTRQQSSTRKIPVPKYMEEPEEDEFDF